MSKSLSMPQFEDRSYQAAAQEATLDFLTRYPKKHGLVVLPTGAGKSISIAKLICKVRAKWNVQILLLSHVKEILEQDLEKLSALLPNEDFGIYSASLGKRQVKPITLGSVQTVVNAAELFTEHKLIIVDEAQMIPESGEGSYNKIFQKLPNARVLGYTATPFRYNSYLVDADHIFTDIIYEVKIPTLIAQGYLAQVSAKETQYEIDTSKLKLVKGDYSSRSMSEHIDKFNITQTICDNLIANAQQFKHWLLFCVSIEHAKHVAEYLTLHGIPTMAVHSKMEKWERELVIRLYKRGKLQSIAQVNIMSVGFDFPSIDMIGLLRPTRSHLFHRQSVGRGLRVAPGKAKCVVFDYAGNFKRLGPIDADPVFKHSKGGKKGGGQAPTKVCPTCNEIMALSVKVCADCGYAWPTAEDYLSKHALGDAVLQSQVVKKAPAKYEVQSTNYRIIKGKNNQTLLKVTYRVSLLKFIDEVIPFESAHPFAQQEVRKWWDTRTNLAVPSTSQEALGISIHLKQPSSIVVDENGKYPKILKYSFYKEAQSNVDVH